MIIPLPEPEPFAQAPPPEDLLVQMELATFLAVSRVGVVAPMQQGTQLSSTPGIECSGMGDWHLVGGVGPTARANRLLWPQACLETGGWGRMTLPVSNHRKVLERIVGSPALGPAAAAGFHRRDPH